MFSDTHCTSEIHFLILNLSKGSEIFYKVNKDKLQYKNNPTGLIDVDKCKTWIDGPRSTTEVGYEYHNKLETFIMILYIQSIYVTLIFHIDGKVECIIEDKHITDGKQITTITMENIIKKCNSHIDKFNENNIHSEKNLEIVKFDINFMNNKSDKTYIDHFECKMKISMKLNKSGKNLVNTNDKFMKIIDKYFSHYFRIESVEPLILRFIKTDNYSSDINIRTIITKFKDPKNIPKLKDEGIIKELKNIFKFDTITANKH